jgi:hypothetical protein
MTRPVSLAVLALGVLIVCGTGGCVGRAEPPSIMARPTDDLRGALLSSPAVRKYVSTIQSPWTYLIDGHDGKAVIVAVGEDMPDHFTRGMTVKVSPDGDVYVLRTPASGDEEWRRE